ALLERLGAGGPIPWFVFDAGYDSAQLSLDLADAGVAVLVRLRSDRCFYADPPPRPPGAGGRPSRRGARVGAVSLPRVRPLLLRRPPTAPARRGRAATPPRRQVRLRRPTTWPAP